ncbi:latexin isoform X1 [Haemorhous mexicanus]|uniref:latexin isoform X1 n=1 Tax=Haemorhous mexicanus TaxID=30427 RepID=UPI0028BE4F6E|nr:latexin isoform X1 [Haemorhous mexicanus]
MEQPPGPRSSRAMELPPSHFPAARAAAAAVGYLRYLRGGPGRGLQVRELRRVRRQDIDDVGHKYYLELELEDVLDKDRTVTCTAEVLYHLGSKTSAPDVQVTVQGELRSTEEADQEFYNRIRSLEKELVAENIPDSHGNVPPELEPIHLLAWVASGYVIWQNSTENTKFHLAQVKHVKQVKRSDEDLQFDFVVLLHEMVSQEIFPFRSLQNGTTGEKETSNVDLKVQLFPKQLEGLGRRKRRWEKQAEAESMGCASQITWA